jgi:exonuclease III
MKFSTYFSMVHLNINSLLSKLPNVESPLNSKTLDILVLQESKIDGTIPNNLILFNGYNLIRHDRTRHGGRIVVYLKDTYSPFNVSANELFKTICFSVKICGFTTNFVVS